MKTLLYLESKGGLPGWEGQSPPILKHQKGKPVRHLEAMSGEVGHSAITKSGSE